MKPLGSGVPGLGRATRGSLLTDGVRWATYEPKAGVTRLIDTKTGRSTNRPDPAGCAGGLIALGGGEMLYRCSNPECPEESNSCIIKPTKEYEEYEYEDARFVVEDIATGAQQPLAGGNHLPTSSVESEGGPGELDGIGTQWAKGIVNTGDGASFFFVNWHNGTVIREEEEPSSAEEDVENLDSTHLLQPLCEPLTRTEEPEESATRFEPTEYAQPFALIAGKLHRCGRSTNLPLPGNGALQLGGGVVSWGADRVTRLHTRGRAWHGPFYRLSGATGSTSSDSLLQHTSTMAFVTVFTGESKPSHIYVAHLP